jgi:aminoglycoside phosphotransferase (APT) family kinase protein
MDDEQQMSPPPRSALPDRPEAITPAWLSEALSASLPGVEVAKVEVVDRHSGTTGRARLALEYASGPAGPETVFVKLPPFGEAQRGLVAATDMGRREARFYAALAAETPVRVPRCYFAAYGEEPTDYLCVLEDLEAAGCTFPKGVERHAREHGGQLIEALARLHAHFWEDARFASELAWVPRAMRGALGAKLIDQARERFAGELPPVFAELCRLYVEHHERICDLWDEGGSTLIHGDCHTGNQFLDGERVGLYDWAVISRSPGIRDVAIFLGNSCPPEVRRTEQDGWLRAYRRGLLDGGVDAPAPDVLLRRLRLAVLYGWVAATATAAVGDRWQPIEVGMTAMRGATQTCTELETLEAFREAL